MMMVSDFHSHILPKVDDGSSCVEESIEMLRLEAKHGVKRVVATPHFYANHDAVGNFLERREAAAKLLRMEMAWCTDMPQVVLGAEVHFFRGISESDILRDMVIEGTNCVLIEMPHAHWSDSMYQELVDISEKRGMTPILAHVDRYISPTNTHRILKRLEQMPVLVQANGSFFLRKSTSAMAIKMLEKKQIHLLGSDCHNMHTRQPNLYEATQVIRGKLGGIKIRGIVANEKMCFNKSVNI